MITFARLLSLLLAGACSVCAAAPLVFEWASPLPHRQTWVDFASGNGVVVGVTDGFGGRSLFVSHDGTDWNAVASPTNAALKKVEFVNGTFTAVGDHNTILTSPDGENWTVRLTDGAAAGLFDVASGNGATVAVGYNGTAFVSSDLKKWTPISGLGNGFSLVGIEFGNGRFVMVGQNGHLLTSTDGFAWTAATWPEAMPVIDGAEYSVGLSFNHGTFVMSSGAIFTSLDGAHWKQASGAQFSKIVRTSAGFLGLEPTVSKSSDGATWEVLLDYATDAGESLNAAAEIAGQIVVGGSNGLLFNSNNGGANWDQTVSEVDYSHSKMVSGNGSFLRFGNAPGVSISNDGADWEMSDTAPALASAAFGNGTWIGIGLDGSINASADARNWQSVAAPLAARAVQFANGLFIAETMSGAIEISRDGAAWKQVQLAGASFQRVLGNVNGRWAAQLDAGRPATSVDGENWTIHPAQSSLKGRIFTAGHDRFIGLGGGGMGPGYVTWSTDGITWQEQARTSGTTYTETSLTFGGGLFLVTDTHGEVYQSSNGLDWLGGRQIEQPLTGAAYSNGRWLIASGDSILRSAALRQASIALVLQLSQNGSFNWSLNVQGAVGASIRIESTTALGQPWTTVRSIEIPLTGRVQLPLTGSAPAAFFRAVSAQ